MRRVAAMAAAATLVPLVVWGAAAAVPEPPLDCSAPENAGAAACVAPAPAEPVEPVPAETPPSTTAPVTTEPATTVVPPPTSTTVPETPTTVESATTTTTSLPELGATTTTTTPTTTIPVDPGATTTTTIDPNTTTTTVDPNATTTTVPVPPEDLDSDPVLPPVEAPGGRIVLPAGAVDSGQTRPITFPVAGPVSYVNDWGACRDGCARAHKGNDLIGDRLQPLLAMHEGVVERLLDHPTAGFGVVIRDTEGWEYHLYHLNNDTPGTDDGGDNGAWRFAAGIVPGARVTAGQLLGWMGDSGNSEASVPHAHVELHRPDGAAINPYWSLRQAQRDVNCAVGPALAEPAAPVDANWLAASWASAPLPAGWQPLAVTGGIPGSGTTAARLWISSSGFTAIDHAALLVGDPRYDAGVDCTVPLEPQLLAPIPTELGAILSTIKSMESGGDYTVTVTTSTASGAYGFLDSSWGGFGGYARAKDAPPAVQDAKAAELAAYILGRNGGDVSTIPVSWYIGHVPAGAEWDTVPPYPGNRLTPREYQDRWMKRYAQFLGTPDSWVGAAPASWKPVDTSVTCHTVVVDAGPPGAPQYVLTQAQSFLPETSGRAVPRATDPCDPGRAVAPSAPALAPAVERDRVPLSGPR